MTTISLLILLLLGAEPFRFDKPLDPRPETVPLPSPTPEQVKEYGPELPPQAAPQDENPTVPQDAETSAAGARPVIRKHSTPGCRPCLQLDKRIADGELAEFEFVDAPPETWMQFVPTLTFEGADGKTYRFDWWSENSRDAPAEFRAAWRRRNPAVALPPLAYGAGTGGASPFDQIHKFTGPGGRFTFQPDQPIATQLDDRTSLKYPSVQGRYTVRDGKVELKLEPPLPVGNYRKFLNFGFQITGGGGPENVTASSMDLRLDTNRGSQRVTIQMEPVK